jgi:hypothetical protein
MTPSLESILKSWRLGVMAASLPRPLKDYVNDLRQPGRFLWRIEENSA